MTLSLKHSLLLALVAFFIVSGICLLVTHSAIFMAIFKSNLVLGPNSASFPMWQKLPEPLSARYILFFLKPHNWLRFYLCFACCLYFISTRMFLFHVLNPDEVSLGQKPKLEQVLAFNSHCGRVVTMHRDDYMSLTYRSDHMCSKSNMRRAVSCGTMRMERSPTGRSGPGFSSHISAMVRRSLFSGT